MTSAEFCKASRPLERDSLDVVLSIYDGLTEIPG